ncbi:MAG: glycosyltransferase [bacterium]|nr:glycosyltransferase [bacterium]
MDSVRKLIYIANFRMPTEKAHGYQVAKMCESFAMQSRRSYADHERGNDADKIEVELIIPTRRNEIKAGLFEYYGIERNFKVTQILTPDFIAMSACLPVGRLFLRKIGFILQSAFFLIKLLAIKPEADSIIYSRNPEIVFLFSRRGYKTVFESHRWPQSKIWLHKYFIKKAYRIVTVTQTLKNLYSEGSPTSFRFGDRYVLVAPDGVDLKIFDVDVSKEVARTKLNLPQNAVLLGYTGHLQTMGEEKGFSEILDALREILKKRDDVYFVSVGGSGPSADKILKNGERFSERVRASEPPQRGLSASETESASNEILSVPGSSLGAEASLGEHLLIVERVPRAKLALYQKAFDVLLMPFPKTTHYSYYMSPMKMFEYMASKRPIVASDLPSVREVLNENNAILVEAGNPKSLAEGIEKILNDPALGQQLAERAYADVQGYTWEKRAQKIINLISN